MPLPQEKYYIEEWTLTAESSFEIEHNKEITVNREKGKKMWNEWQKGGKNDGSLNGVGEHSFFF